ncbi:MAG TPA: malto-oligosyltrehalose trehalohydrolase [Myxococcota bacterium]|nr:malto-oligosyltrehalose trehalohydrolase [Myxococcota bacterium]
MARFELWAPRARRVELVIPGERIRLRRASGGWFRSDLPLDRELDYGFALDGGEPLPDPRSRWQPDGVFGLSRTLRPSAFHWTDAEFRPEPLSRAIFYELHVGTFTPHGTFLSTIERLDHLVELGVTHVELMPVAAFSGAHGWGYDGVAPFAPHPAYGSPDELRTLVQACHARGLAVVFDVVHNHLGPEGCFQPRFGPYFSETHATAWGPALNFDGPDSDEVRRYFIDSALAWLRDYHGDGLRLDAVHSIRDDSALHFLEELRIEVDRLSLALGRPLFLIAESDANDPRLVTPRRDGGHGLDAVWNDDFHHALHVFLTGEGEGYYADFAGCSDLVEALARGFVYAGRYSSYRRRRHGRPDPRPSGAQLVGFGQNHDQIGNRARGDRYAQTLSPERLRVAAGLVLTAPFIPLLFQGEEWGARTPFPFFCDYADPELREAVRRGRREALAATGSDSVDLLDPCAHETFRRAKLDWDELADPRHQSVLRWYRELIALRRGTRALAAGPLLGPDVRCSEKELWISLRRGSLQIVAHAGSESASIPVERSAQVRIALASGASPRLTGDRLELAPDSLVILAPL